MRATDGGSGNYCVLDYLGYGRQLPILRIKTCGKLMSFFHCLAGRDFNQDNTGRLYEFQAIQSNSNSAGSSLRDSRHCGQATPLAFLLQLALLAEAARYVIRKILGILRIMLISRNPKLGYGVCLSVTDGQSRAVQSGPSRPWLDLNEKRVRGRRRAVGFLHPQPCS